MRGALEPVAEYRGRGAFRKGISLSVPGGEKSVSEWENYKDVVRGGTGQVDKHQVITEGIKLHRMIFTARVFFSVQLRVCFCAKVKKLHRCDKVSAATGKYVEDNLTTCK